MNSEDFPLLDAACRRHGYKGPSYPKPWRPPFPFNPFIPFFVTPGLCVAETYSVVARMTSYWRNR